MNLERLLRYEGIRHICFRYDADHDCAHACGHVYDRDAYGHEVMPQYLLNESSYLYGHVVLYVCASFLYDRAYVQNLLLLHVFHDHDARENGQNDHDLCIYVLYAYVPYACVLHVNVLYAQQLLGAHENGHDYTHDYANHENKEVQLRSPETQDN